MGGVVEMMGWLRASKEALRSRKVGLMELDLDMRVSEDRMLDRNQSW